MSVWNVSRGYDRWLMMRLNGLSFTPVYIEMCGKLPLSTDLQFLSMSSFSPWKILFTKIGSKFKILLCMSRAECDHVCHKKQSSFHNEIGYFPIAEEKIVILLWIFFTIQKYLFAFDAKIPCISLDAKSYYFGCFWC